MGKLFYLILLISALISGQRTSNHTNPLTPASHIVYTIDEASVFSTGENNFQQIMAEDLLPSLSVHPAAHHLSTIQLRGLPSPSTKK